MMRLRGMGLGVSGMKVILCGMSVKGDGRGISTLLDLYAAARPDFGIEYIYAAPEEIIESPADFGDCGVIITDVRGAEAASRLHALSDRVVTIIISKHKMSGASYGEVIFIAMPLTEEKLFCALDNALNIDGGVYISVRSGGRVRRVRAGEIVMIQSSERLTGIHLQSGEVLSVKCSFSAVYSELRELKEFVRIGVTDLVNVRCIKRICDNYAELTNDEIVMLSEKKGTALKKAYENLSGAVG